MENKSTNVRIRDVIHILDGRFLTKPLDITIHPEEVRKDLHHGRNSVRQWSLFQDVDPNTVH